MADRSDAETWRLSDPHGGHEGEPLVGALLGGCRIIERVGQGAMAVVYRAEQAKLGRTVALKVLRRASWERRSTPRGSSSRPASPRSSSIPTSSRSTTSARNAATTTS